MHRTWRNERASFRHSAIFALVLYLGWDLITSQHTYAIRHFARRWKLPCITFVKTVLEPLRLELANVLITMLTMPGHVRTSETYFGTCDAVARSIAGCQFSHGSV